MIIIGHGSFGTIYAVNKYTAWKRFTRHDGYISCDLNEVVALQHLKNIPHVIQIHKIEKIQRGIPCSFTMDRHAGSIYERGLSCGWDVRKVIGQLLIAVNCIHTLGIAHRDITLKNLLMDRNDNVVLCDFGTSALVDVAGPLKSKTIIDLYMPPYKLNRYYINKKATLAADIWSCGLIALQLELKAINISHHSITRIIDSGQKDAIRQLLELDYRKSKTAAELLTHQYFDGFNIPDIPIPKRAPIQKTPEFDNCAIEMINYCYPSNTWNNRKVACLGLSTNLFRRHYELEHDTLMLSLACAYLSITYLMGGWPIVPHAAIDLSQSIAKKDKCDWISLVPRMDDAKSWTKEEVYNMFGLESDDLEIHV